MRFSAKLVPALILLGASITAHADTITQSFDYTFFVNDFLSAGSGSSDLGSVSPFNPALGTLDSVTLDVRDTVSAASGGATLTVTDSANSDSYSVSSDYFASTTFSSPSELSDFEHGPLDATYSWNVNNGIIDGYGDDADVIYTYTPNVTPEPSSLMLLGTGMLGVAGSLYRRCSTGRRMI